MFIIFGYMDEGDNFDKRKFKPLFRVEEKINRISAIQNKE